LGTPCSASCAAAPAADAGTRTTNANRTATIDTLRRCLTSPRLGKNYPRGPIARQP
jgi:hypothetical protein